MPGLISAVHPDSLAARLGLRPGDELLAINGHPLRDLIDVQFYGPRSG
jgi:S1-C subfamily serine protease